MAELAAECRDLMQIYSSAAGPVAALRGISAQLQAGSLTAVVGPSGCGKLTLLRVLACLEQPTAGDLWLQGQPTAHLTGRARRKLAARTVGYVFQRPIDNLASYLSVEENLRFASCMRQHPANSADIDALFEATALTSLRRQRASDLSVGAQQRLAFAMAVVGEPTIVVADEPTAELDADEAAIITELLPDLVGVQQAIVLASHDPSLIAATNHVLVIRRGTLAAESIDGGELLSVIDDAGRMQLPVDSDELFPTNRAHTVREPTGLRLERP
jgi:ABC-type lipoprotein export system ATPase subunit